MKQWEGEQEAWAERNRVSGVACKEPADKGKGCEHRS